MSMMSDWRIALLKNYAFVSKLVAKQTQKEKLMLLKLKILNFSLTEKKIVDSFVIISKQDMSLMSLNIIAFFHRSLSYLICAAPNTEGITYSKRYFTA